MKKRIVCLAICCLLCMCAVTSCATQIKGDPVAYDSLADLAGAVGFEMVEPSVVPDGYVLAGYFAIEDKVAEILYMSGESELVFAQTRVKNIDLDSGEAEETRTEQYGDYKYELSMTDGFVDLAVTRKNGFTYAIFSSSGLSPAEVEMIAAGISL